MIVLRHRLFERLVDRSATSTASHFVFTSIPLMQDDEEQFGGETACSSPAAGSRIRCSAGNATTTATDPRATPPNAAAPTAATPATAPNAAPNAAAPTAAAPTAAPHAAGPDNASDGENSDVAAAEEHDDGDEAAETTDGASAWKPEDDFQEFSQRVKTMGDERRFNPILNLDGYSSKGIFEYTEHFLPMHHGARTTRALVPHLVPPPRQPTRPAAAFKHEMVASREGQKAGQREG